MYINYYCCDDAFPGIEAIYIVLFLVNCAVLGLYYDVQYQCEVWRVWCGYIILELLLSAACPPHTTYRQPARVNELQWRK